MNKTQIRKKLETLANDHKLNDTVIVFSPDYNDTEEIKTLKRQKKNLIIFYGEDLIKY